MPFEPEWLYLDELLALLGPSPDMAAVEFRFRRALDEGALQDRDGTPSGVWHERLERGDVVFSWTSGTIIVPWYDRLWREYHPKPLHPQFRRAAWLSVYSDLVPATAEIEATTEETPPPEEVMASESEQLPISKSRLKVPQPKLTEWYEERVKNWPPGKKPPSSAEDWAAAREHFPEFRVTRDQITDKDYGVRPKHAPPHWTKKGRRPDFQDPDKLTEKLAIKCSDKINSR